MLGDENMETITIEKSKNLEKFLISSRKDLEMKIKSDISNKQIVTIVNGGKRLRPLLSILAFKVCNYGKETPQKYQRALEGAVSIELAHTASLVHDDIIDNDMNRRGRKALHIKKGIPNALLIGHKMINKGIEIAKSHGEKIFDLYIETWKECLNGQLEEVTFNKKEVESESDQNVTLNKSKLIKKYQDIINKKTASLFSAACKAGGLEAGVNGSILKLLADYGTEIGLAYQLADDLVDLEKGEMINSVILPLMVQLTNSSFDNNSIKMDIIKRKIEKNKTKIKQFYIDEIKKHIKKAEEMSKSKILPDSSYRDLLVEFPSYIINKMLKEVNIVI